MTTPILSLDEWTEAQAQPHATVNESLRWLECFAALAVLSLGDNTPPGSPAAGDRYVLGTSPTGVWSGHAKAVALYFGTAWQFKTAPNGTLAYVIDEDASYRYLSGTWTIV